MVSGPLSIGPIRSGLRSAASEIFDIDADIAAELAVGVARNSNDSAESEAKPAARIEPGHRRHVRADRFEADGSAVEAGELDAVRQLYPNLAAGLAANGDFAQGGTRADRGHRPDRSSGSVRPQLGTAGAGAGQDKPVEVEVGRNLKGHRRLRTLLRHHLGWAAQKAGRRQILGRRRHSKTRGAKQRDSGRKGE